MGIFFSRKCLEIKGIDRHLCIIIHIGGLIVKRKVKKVHKSVNFTEFGHVLHVQYFNMEQGSFYLYNLYLYSYCDVCCLVCSTHITPESVNFPGIRYVFWWRVAILR